MHVLLCVLGSQLVWSVGSDLIAYCGLIACRICLFEMLQCKD